MKKQPLFVVLAFVVLIAGSCGKKTEESSETATPAPPAEPTLAELKVHIDPRLVKNWMIGLTNRRPGLNAKRGVALGEGALGVNSTPDAVAWFEVADIDSNGTKEKVGFMWDATSKTMYAYTHDPVMLEDGTMADRGLLVAQYGDGNSKSRPLGSGFWAYATTRDTTSSGEMKGTLFGCRFDKTGAETECGTGEWSRTDNDFAIQTKMQ
jgi:hypothetical protein